MNIIHFEGIIKILDTRIRFSIISASWNKIQFKKDECNFMSIGPKNTLTPGPE